MQVVPTTSESSGNPQPKTRKRLKAAHLSEKFRRRIVDLFTVHESADDVADVLRGEMRGLTGKTVLEVVVLERVARPPARELSPAQGLRRFA